MIKAILAHKVITVLVAVVMVAAGVTGVAFVTNGNSSRVIESHGNHGNSSNCAGVQCDTQIPPRTASKVCSTRPAGTHPRFIAIMVQGIGSYVQTVGPDANHPGNDLSGELTTFNPARISYCATSPNWPKDPLAPQGTDPPNNPNTVIRSMADGWLNYSVNFLPANLNGLQESGYASPDKSTVTSSNGEDIINELAEAGGYVLPFSYFDPFKGTLSNGQVPLPNAAFMAGKGANPTFSFLSYNGSDVAAGDPQYQNPPVLNFEIASINKVFPKVPIIIIGHSNGGLIAEQWWLRYGTKVPCGNINVLGVPQCGMHGVEHVFTLDSPINGVDKAFLCDNGFNIDLGGDLAALGVNSLCSGAIDTTEAGEYAGMYQSNVTLMEQAVIGNTSNPDPNESDPLIQILDTQKTNPYPQRPANWPSSLPWPYPQGFLTQPGTFTAVGTYGDPLYDAGNASDLLSEHLGAYSQFVFTLPCLNHPDLTTSQCAPLKGVGSKTVPPLDFASPCSDSYSGTTTSYTNEADADYTPYFNGLGNSPNPTEGVLGLVQIYGLPGSLYIHSQAKDCPGTVNMIVNYARILRPKATLHPKVMNPSAAATAAWKATANDASNTVGAALRGVTNLLPASEDPAQIAQLNQLATIPLAELDMDTPTQQAEGHGDITALDKFFGTPGLMPGTGSNTGGTSPTTTSPPTTPPPTLVTPGNGSPGDAVDGFYQSELAGDWAAVCSYVTPSAQSLCLDETSGQGAATGTANVGTMVLSADGNEALVSVTGSICAPSSPCVSNGDASLGMPSSPSQFPADYQAAVANTTSSTTVLSPMPCSQIGGKWYVDFG